jgi:oligoribonuclease NrnB/cAMP/cGMP phosphodiesterase (DHH superfamily)
MARLRVLHHGDWDGVTAAWIVCQARMGLLAPAPLNPVERYEIVACEAVNYDAAPPHVEADEDVLLLDYCPRALALQHLLATARSVSLIDHHRSAIEMLQESGLRESLRVCILDEGRSGCGLTWQWLHGDTPPPALVRYVEDHDLWRFSLPASRAVRRWIQSFAPTVSNAAVLDGVAPALVPDAEFPEHVLEIGSAIERAVGALVEAIVERASSELIAGVAVPTANSPVLVSEVGAELARRHPEAPYSCVWADGPRSRLHSLRSLAGGAAVSAVARRFGGGGHENAAGFHLRRGESPWCTTATEK